MKISRNSPTIALLLILASADCAHAPDSPKPVAVTSDSWIKIGDGPSSEPTCNRPAMEVIALRRLADKMTAPLAIDRANERAEIAEAHAKAAEKYASSVDWWYRYGEIITVIVGAAGLGAGTVFGVVLGRLIH